MAMVQATALENQRAQEHRGYPQDDSADGGVGVGNFRQCTRAVILCVASLILVAAAGGFTLASKVGQSHLPVVAADNALGKSRAIGSAGTASEPVEGSLSKEEPRGLGAIGEKKLFAEEVRTGGMGAAPPDDPTIAASVTEQQIKKLGSGVEPQGEGGTEPQISTQTPHSDPIAPTTDKTSDQPVPPQTPSPPSASGTGSTIDRANDPVPIRIARTISGVRMRVGPSNEQAVLAIIPGGSSVEVINCRQWCEVIFAGQRGWIYKGFIGASPIPRRP